MALGQIRAQKGTPKFYFFDTGVVRSIQNRLTDAPTAVERGILFEQWFINELRLIKDYHYQEYDFSFWRQGTLEMDIVVTRAGKPVAAFECKSGRDDPHREAIKSFQKKFPKVPVLIVAADSNDHRHLDNGIKILPAVDALKQFTQ